MLTTLMKRSALITAVCLVSFSAHAMADDHTKLNLPAGELVTALKSLAKQTDVELVYSPQQLKGMQTKGLQGTYSAHAAVSLLLKGTPLHVYTDATGAMVISLPGSAASPPATSHDEQKASRSFWDRFRVAQAAPADDNFVNTIAENRPDDLEPKNSRVLQAVIVTAQKNVERLQDVPVPVTAVSAQTLVDNNQLRTQDYFATIPGLSITAGDHGEPYLAIRGVTASPYANPSVGVTIDDVPYGSSTNLGGGSIAPDIDPSDLARIEVLRGPQGTLYGANSMGGLIKYVTIDPSTAGASGHVQVGTSTVYNGTELGYSARAAANVPLTDTWAVRASGFTRIDPGYVDNVRSGERGVNETRADGGRLSSLWRPSDAFSLKISALLQEVRADGTSDVFRQPNLADLQQDVLPGSGTDTTKTQSYSATLTAALGRATLTALSGYNIQSDSGWYDVTSTYGAYALSTFGVDGSASESVRTTDKFTQEVRLGVPITQRLDWLLGGFYTHEKSVFLQDYVAADPVTGALGTSFVAATFPSSYSEYAAFTDLTLHITDRFDVQAGGRESQIKQVFRETLGGILVGGTSITQGNARASAFTYLVTPRFRVSSDLMTYARLASGYRPGGPNINAAVLGVPTQFDPDKTQNYEIGVKGTALDRALSFDASLYYIKWDDIQISVRQRGFGYYANGGGAKSQGVELSVESRPLRGLTVSAWIAWNDAVLKQPFPADSTVYGASGDSLPNSSRLSGNVSLQQDFPLTGRASGFVGGEVSYVGDRVGMFQKTSVRQIYPPYAKTDLRAGVRYDLWTLNIFVTNLTNRRGELAGGLDASPITSFRYIEPRTVGLSFSRMF